MANESDVVAESVKAFADVAGGKVDPNLAEVTYEERVKAEMARIQAKEAEMIRAEAEALVQAEIDREAEAKRIAAEDAVNAKARADAAALRAKQIKAFSSALSKFMCDNDIDNPRALTDADIDAIRGKAGL